MKTLYESILDDEDDIMDTMGEDIINNTLSDREGPFIKNFFERIRFYDEYPPKYIDKDNTIFIRPASSSNKSDIKIINTEKRSCQSYGLPQDVIIKSSKIIASHPWGFVEFSPNTYCGGLTAHHVDLDGFDLIKDVDFKLCKIIKEDDYQSMVAPRMSFNSYNPMILKNVNITFEGVPVANQLLYFRTHQFPEFHNVTTTANTIQLSDTFFFDQGNGLDQLEKIVRLDTSVKILDTKLNQEVERPLNSAKKMYSTVNNKKRYINKSGLPDTEVFFPINPNARLDSVFVGINDCKTIKHIYASDLNVLLVLTKQKFKNKTYTADGWCVLQFQKR